MIREIVKYPEPVLAKKAEPVVKFDAALETLVADMFDSMYAAEGIGLAGPQVAVSQRVVVIDLSFQKDPQQKIVLINPEIIYSDGKQREEEGCLSLPDIRAKVDRAATVRVRAQNVKGETIEFEGIELLSRAFQHEIDHIDGILFIDRVSRLKRDLLIRRIKKLQQAGEW
jgi:peptide deformylase